MNFSDIKMSYKFLGKTTPATWGNTQVNSYKVTIKYNSNQFAIDYHMGLGLNLSDITVEQIIYSALLDSSCTQYDFNEFCNEFGYDNNRVRGLKIYKACKQTTKKLHNMFNESELKYLQDYIDKLDF